MRIERLAPLLFLSLLLCVSLGAQQTSTSDAQAVSLSQSALSALTSGFPLNDITLAGSARRVAGSDDESGQFTAKATALSQSRLEFSFPSGPRAELCDASGDTPSGSWAGPDRAVHPIAFHNLRTEPAWFHPAFLLGHALAPGGSKFTYVGKESRSDAAVLHFAVWQLQNLPADTPADLASQLQELTRADVYLDATSLLPVAVAFATHPDNDMGLSIPIEVQFSDYRAVNGVRIPFRIQKFLNNGLILDLTVKEAQLNTGIAAAEFKAQ